MREAARRQILLDMGIVPWRLRARRSLDDAAPESTARAPERQRPRATPPPAAVAETVSAGEPSATGRAVGEPDRPAPLREPPAAAGVRAWSALSLATPGVLLLADGSSSRRDQRLAADLLAAVTGDWRARPVERRFEWPPVMMAAADDDGRRAFGAFVDKDVTDHGVRLLLCVESLAWALPEQAFGCPQQVIPPLAVLGGDAEAKRALWRTLEGHRP